MGYIAHFEYINGFEKTLYWTADQMMAHADKYSPAFSAKEYQKLLNGEIPQEDMWKYSSFWYKDFDGMAKKTMLRQLISKWGIMTVEMTTAYERDDRVMMPDVASGELLPEVLDPAEPSQKNEAEPPKIERTAKTMDLPEQEQTRWKKPLIWHRSDGQVQHHFNRERWQCHDSGRFCPDRLRRTV